jgi:hypothetical protein
MHALPLRPMPSRSSPKVPSLLRVSIFQAQSILIHEPRRYLRTR